MSKQDKPIGMYGDTRTSSSTGQYAMVEELQKINKSVRVIRGWVTLMGVVVVLGVIAMFAV